MARLAPMEDTRAWPPLKPGEAGDVKEELQEETVPPWMESGGRGPQPQWQAPAEARESWGGEWTQAKGKGKGKNRRRKGDGKWVPKGGDDAVEATWEGSSSRAKGSSKGGKGWSANSELLGEWLDSQDNEVLVQSGPRGGPLTARLSRKGGRAQVLSVRREPESGLWACGNAVLDNAASSANVLVWAAYDGRKSVWRRKEVGIEADPEDLLPWLLRVPAMQGLGLSQMAKGKELPKAKGANGKTEGGFSPPRRRQRNWSSISMDSDIAGVFVASAEEQPVGNSSAGDTCKTSSEEMVQHQPESTESGQDAVVSTTGKVPAYFDTFNAAADAARVSAILDARQVLGAAGNYQEIFSYLLIDHDLLRTDGEDPMVPSLSSTLWQRLPETPRRNVLQRLTAFHDGSFVPGSYVAEFPAGNWSEVFVGRHRFPVVHTDIQALLKRYTLAEDNVASRASAMARVLSLYRALENPAIPAGQRSSHQLCASNPASRAAEEVEYELFASPFNAAAENGKYASRFPHAEEVFGSGGSYPSVLDKWPSTAVVTVNPPFSDAYLEDVFGKQLDRLVSSFRKVQMFAPVRDAPWRPQLRRLQGARFVQQFWDATAMRDRHLEQPVLHWQGDKLAPGD
ncbi:unnamed protein product [Durusdinium trenchii]|uniref:Uncharacterized protein n=2 Tax=Durusdinium trenchii TaxID=1381693 RepID=A0ABP0JT22_9DINO